MLGSKAQVVGRRGYAFLTTGAAVQIFSAGPLFSATKPGQWDMVPIAGRCTDEVVARVGVELAMRGSGERTSESMAAAPYPHLPESCGHKCSPGCARDQKEKVVQNSGGQAGEEKQGGIYSKESQWSKKKSSCACSPTGLGHCQIQDSLRFTTQQLVDLRSNPGPFALQELSWTEILL